MRHLQAGSGWRSPAPADAATWQGINGKAPESPPVASGLDWLDWDGDPANGKRAGGLATFAGGGGEVGWGT